MVLNTLTVGAAVTPSVIETAIAHYVNRAPLRGKPTAHISYDEGLHLVRQFLEYASNHSVDEVQAFTAQWVPCPRWVKVVDISIPETHLTRAAALLTSQLGPSGVAAVGGTQWWQWRPSSTPLNAEWIEMRAHYNARKALSQPAQRIIMYIHGGAYYFGSIDEHRYQLQRHARKMKARLLAPRYRLAPQFPFPCGLQDAIASYLHVITEYSPSNLLLMGDSAGAGMVLSLLVTLRDQNIPLPAGAVLISPWVDLTHSFPSVSGDGSLDYIPAHGFHHRPSAAFPPPNDDELRELQQTDIKKGKHTDPVKEGQAVKGVREQTAADHQVPQHLEPAPNPPQLSINIDGKHITLIDQIQIYAANSLLSHPLVSPALQPSLGGLPPLLIQTGGGELLCDEQVYLAHKAADPTRYPAPEVVLDLHDPKRELAGRFPPTKVQLQVWEDLCHVPHTLSFTRPAKHMYRAVAQFGNHIFSQGGTQGKPVEEDGDDSISIVSTSTAFSETTNAETRARSQSKSEHNVGRSMSEGADPDRTGHLSSSAPTGRDWASTASIRANNLEPGNHEEFEAIFVSASADLPQYRDSMIRQLVDRHGQIWPLPGSGDIPCLNLPRETIGQIKPGPVRKWLAKKAEWDRKFASQKRRVQVRRLEEMRRGYAVFEAPDGTIERPPPTALAGRQVKGKKKSRELMAGTQNLEAGSGVRKKKSWGLAMWSGWGSKHDESTVERSKQDADSSTQVAGSSPTGRSRTRQASRTGERSASAGGHLRNPLARVLSRRSSRGGLQKTRSISTADIPPVPSITGSSPVPGTLEAQDQVTAAALPKGDKIEGSDNTFLAPNTSRPHNGTVAYPFKLKGNSEHGRSASTMTLDSAASEIVEPISPSSATAEGAGEENGPVANSSDNTAAAEEQHSEAGHEAKQRPKLESFVTAEEF